MAQGRKNFGFVCHGCHVFYMGLVVCVDASIRRLAVLVGRFGRGALGHGLVCLLCNSGWRVGGTLSQVVLACAATRRALRHTCQVIFVALRSSLRPGRCGHVCRALDLGRVGQRAVVHWLSLGRCRLCAWQQLVGGVCPMGGCVWHGCHCGADGHGRTPHGVCDVVAAHASRVGFVDCRRAVAICAASLARAFCPQLHIPCGHDVGPLVAGQYSAR